MGLCISGEKKNKKTNVSVFHQSVPLIVEGDVNYGGNSVSDARRLGYGSGAVTEAEVPVIESGVREFGKTCAE